MSHLGLWDELETRKQRRRQEQGTRPTRILSMIQYLLLGHEGLGWMQRHFPLQGGRCSEAGPLQSGLAQFRVVKGRIIFGG